MDTTALQRALIALGYPLPKFGADGGFGGETRSAMQAFQRKAVLPATDKPDAPTIAALQAALAADKPAATPRPAAVAVPMAWLPTARLERVIVHWTAGQHRASPLDRSHYHILIEGDGTLIRGTPSIAGNGIGATGPRASHTLNCNTGSIGVSLCCMAGAMESPFQPGPAPMTRLQWSALPSVVADLCRRYSIPVTPRTVLSHAEVQATLGIQQRGKWDIARLAFDPSVVGAKACGNLLRAGVSALL